MASICANETIVVKYRILETTYGPAVRFNDWTSEDGKLIATGGCVQVRASKPTTVNWRGYPFGAVGGDIELTLGFEFDGVTDDSDFVVHLHRRPNNDSTGFTFRYHKDAVALHYRGDEVFRKDMVGDRFRRPHELRLATLGESYACWLDDQCIAAGEMIPPFTDNEGQIIVEANVIELMLTSFAERLIAHDVDPPAWSRAEVLYEEAYTAQSLSDQWFVNGEPPNVEDGTYIFNFESNYILRPRFDEPIVVDFVATPMPAPRWHSAGVTDAIFLWRVDKPDGDVFDYLANVDDGNRLSALIPLSLYWVDFGGTNNVTTRLRKNPQRHMVRQFVDRDRLMKRHRSYRITLVQRDHWLEYHVDGEPWVQAYDPSPLRGGHIGFRAYMADLKIANLKVWSIA